MILALIYFSLAAFSLFISKSKLLTAILILVMWITLALNTLNPDTQTYELIYNGYYGQSHEPGFDLLCTLFSNMGVPYQAFWTMLTTFDLVLILGCIQRLFGRIDCRALALFMMCPLLMMVVPLRNTTASALGLAALCILFSGKQDLRIRNVLFLALMALAASIHYSALFYLILLLSGRIRSVKRTFVVAAALALLSSLLANLPTTTNLVDSLFSSDKVSSWFDESNRIGFGFFLVFGMHIANFALHSLSMSRIRAVAACDQITNEIDRLIYGANVLSFFLVGLYSFNAEFFYRTYIFFILLNIFHLGARTSEAYERRALGISDVVMLVFGQLLYDAALFVLYFGMGDGINLVIAPIFGNNLLFP